MEALRGWDVTVACRVEGVTDAEDFPHLLLSALQDVGAPTVIQLNAPTVAHSTSVVLRINAASKNDAEGDARSLVLSAVGSVARRLRGDVAFGWSIHADAIASQA
jgi:hypothetical protein